MALRDNKSSPSRSPTRRPTKCGSASSGLPQAARSGSAPSTASVPACCENTRRLWGLRKTTQSTMSAIAPRHCVARWVSCTSMPRSLLRSRSPGRLAGQRTISLPPISISPSPEIRWEAQFRKSTPLTRRSWPVPTRLILTICCCTWPRCFGKAPKCGRAWTSATAISWSTSTRTRTWPNMQSPGPSPSTIRTWR